MKKRLLLVLAFSCGSIMADNGLMQIYDAVFSASKILKLQVELNKGNGDTRIVYYHCGINFKSESEAKNYIKLKQIALTVVPPILLGFFGNILRLPGENILASEAGVTIPFASFITWNLVPLLLNYFHYTKIEESVASSPKDRLPYSAIIKNKKNRALTIWGTFIATALATTFARTTTWFVLSIPGKILSWPFGK